MLQINQTMPMATSEALTSTSQMDFSKHTIADVQTAKSGKSAQILRGKDLHMVQFGAMEAPFNASAYNEPDASRVNLCMRTTPAIEDFLAEYEAWLMDYCQQESARLFGKQMSLDEVKFMYTPLLKMSDKYPTLWKVKLNKTGRHAVRCWDKDTRQKMTIPEDWREYSITPRVWIKSLWIQSKSFGVTMELVDALLNATGPTECPIDFEENAL